MKTKTTIASLLKEVGKEFNTVTVPEDMPISEIVDHIFRAREERIIFVTGETGKLVGIVSLGDLARHFFAEGIYHRKDTHIGSNILRYLTARTAHDIMTRNFTACRMEDELGAVIKRMTSGSRMIKTLPILDDTGRVIGTLDSLEILEFLAGNGAGG